MSERYPLFPELSDVAREEAQILINKFKVRLKDAAEEVLGTLYCEIIYHIESDAWTNFRSCLMDGLRNYNNRKLQADYDFKEIRRKIFEEFREEIINDLNQDNLELIATLKADLIKNREFCRSFHS